ncbi:MAG: FAD:protein FMN transferase [Romboutsia sp.]
MRNKFIIIMTAIVLPFILSGCVKEEKQSKPLSRTEIFMGTAIKITLYNGGSDKILDKAFNRVVEIENLVSINKDGTEIDKLNENAGISSVKVSDTSYDIIDKGLYYSELSKGKYDLTVGPLVKLWSIGLPEAKVPTNKEINEIIKNIDYSKVKMNPETKEVFLTEKNMMLDLGSIAKGYATDEIVNILKKEGVEQAIVNLGGNIYAMGLKNGTSNWKIGIQNPFDERGSIVGSIEVTDKSVVTSGVYERFIEKDSIKYHHILSPKTGYPYETEIAGVSIIADKSIDADALSTLVFTEGLKEGIELVNNLDGVDAIFITSNKKVYMTDGLKESFEMKNKEFVLSN